MSMRQQELDSYTPEKINNELFKGKSRETLAEEYGHKSYRAIDMFMRRSDYKWDKERGIYDKRAIKSKLNEEVTPTTRRLRKILQLFEEEKDPRGIAKETGFKNHLALSQYMKDNDYSWNSKSCEYEQVVGRIDCPEDVEQHIEVEHHDNIDQMKGLPRYSLSGVKVAKTIHISNKLNELIKDFTEEKGINQREFIEISTIEALSKYGYNAEVKGILS